MKKALITGINGQDGSYLAEYLIEKGYEVYGTIRRNSVSENQTARLNSIFDQICDNLFYIDLTDMSSILRILKKIEPDEIYNLGAQSHVRISFDSPIYTAESTAIGFLNLLECVKILELPSKIYQASSSEMFGNNIDQDGFQRETTKMTPVSPYGCAKVFAYNIGVNYRNSYDMFISNGILFNHESPRRGLNFVTNKVCYNAVRLKKGLIDSISLGNLNSYRDWGHAKDYIKAMWMILQLEQPGDYVCSTGVTHSVKDLVEYVFNVLDIPWEDKIIIDPKYYRPEELHILKGDSSKLKMETGWKPEYTFESMLDEMIDYWMKKI